MLLASGCGTTSLNDPHSRTSGKQLSAHLARHAHDPLTLTVTGNEGPHQSACGSSKRFITVASGKRAAVSGRIQAKGLKVVATSKGGPRVKLKLESCTAGAWAETSSTHARVLVDGSYSAQVSLPSSGRLWLKANYEDLPSTKTYLEVR